MSRAAATLLAMLTLGGCVTDWWADEPATVAAPVPQYSFDIGKSKALFVEAAALHREGDAAAAISKTEAAIHLFPLDPGPYRLMLEAAAKAEDVEALRFARFFDARLPSIERYGPWIAAQHFKSAANANRAEPIKDIRIRANAGRISAYLSAMICDTERRRASTDAERLNFIRRYGVEGVVNQMRLWLEELPDDCPRVSVQ